MSSRSLGSRVIADDPRQHLVARARRHDLRAVHRPRLQEVGTLEPPRGQPASGRTATAWSCAATTVPDCAATRCWSRPAGPPTATCSTRSEAGVEGDRATAKSSSTSTSARPRAGYSPSATSRRTISSSTWPTTRRVVVKHNLLQDWDDTDALMPLRPPVCAVGGVHRPADRQRRAHRKPGPGKGIQGQSKVQDFGDVAYGWAMEDTTGIAKIIVDDDTRADSRRTHHGPSGLVVDPAADPGDELRPACSGDGAWPVLDPPRIARGDRERAVSAVRRAALAARRARHWTSLDGRCPALPDLSEAPDRQGDQPSRDEQPDDHEADELRFADPITASGPRLDAEAVGQQAGGAR